MKWSKETIYNFDVPALLLKVPGQPLRECFIAGVAVEVYVVFDFSALFWLPSHDLGVAIGCKCMTLLIRICPLDTYFFSRVCMDYWSFTKKVNVLTYVVFGVISKSAWVKVHLCCF